MNEILFLIVFNMARETITKSSHKEVGFAGKIADILLTSVPFHNGISTWHMKTEKPIR